MLKHMNLHPACFGAAESGMLKNIQHVETATDKKRHVEGMKKGMFKTGAAESSMLKLLEKKKAC